MEEFEDILDTKELEELEKSTESFVSLEDLMVEFDSCRGL